MNQLKKASVFSLSFLMPQKIISAWLSIAYISRSRCSEVFVQKRTAIDKKEASKKKEYKVFNHILLIYNKVQTWHFKSRLFSSLFCCSRVNPSKSFNERSSFSSKEAIFKLINKIQVLFL